jgi:transposase
MTQILTNEDREFLKKRQRTEKDRHSLDRIRCVLLKDKGWSSEKIAEALFIHQTTADGYIRDFAESGKLFPAHKGSLSKLSDLQAIELQRHVEESCYMTAKEIVEHIRKTYEITYSTRGMTNWLHKNGFVHKKPKKVPYKADPQAQQTFLDTYQQIEKQAALKNAPVLFVDSVHPSQETNVTYGWIKKGTDKLIPSHGGRKRMNICGAINLATMDLISKEYETINKENFQFFLEKIRAFYPGKGDIHLILDQAGYHIAHCVKQYALENNIKLHYLPAHSPNLNAIERLWKVMKETVVYNKFYGTFSLFRDAIEKFLTVTYAGMKNSLVSRLTDNFHIPLQAK